MTRDSVHVIIFPSPGPPAVAALAHILDDSDPCCNFEEDSFEDVGGQWHNTSSFRRPTEEVTEQLPRVENPQILKSET